MWQRETATEGSNVVLKSFGLLARSNRLVTKVYLPLFAVLGCAAPALAGSFASLVVSYNPGSTASSGYTTPGVALGSPERMTGELFGSPGVVSLFNSPFAPDEIVSIGEGGSLTVRFDEPIQDDASNLYGVDLILFGNAGFILGDFVNQTITDPAALFGEDNALIEVSQNGIDFFPVPANADTLFPTQGYLDSGLFDEAPGSLPTDFFRPVNPALSLADFDGLTYAGALALYDGSGGGTPIDIGSTGLFEASYVRISVLDDGNTGTSLNAEMDAFARVPEPSAIVLLAVAALLTDRRYGHRRIRA